MTGEPQRIQTISEGDLSLFLAYQTSDGNRLQNSLTKASEKLLRAVGGHSVYEGKLARTVTDQLSTVRSRSGMWTMRKALSDDALSRLPGAFCVLAVVVCPCLGCPGHMPWQLVRKCIPTWRNHVAMDADDVVGNAIREYTITLRECKDGFKAWLMRMQALVEVNVSALQSIPIATEQVEADKFAGGIEVGCRRGSRRW